MKTPHRITLVRGASAPKYDPLTDNYTEERGAEVTVPCFVNFISQAKVFELYGSRKEKIMICRFQQVQEPFSHAFYKGERYELLDQIDAPVKGVVRLKRAGD